MKAVNRVEETMIIDKCEYIQHHGQLTKQIGKFQVFSGYFSVSNNEGNEQLVQLMS